MYQLYEKFKGFKNVPFFLNPVFWSSDDFGKYHMNTFFLILFLILIIKLIGWECVVHIAYSYFSLVQWKKNSRAATEELGH